MVHPRGRNKPVTGFLEDRLRNVQKRLRQGRHENSTPTPQVLTVTLLPGRPTARCVACPSISIQFMSLHLGVDVTIQFSMQCSMLGSALIYFSAHHRTNYNCRAGPPNDRVAEKQHVAASTGWSTHAGDTVDPCKWDKANLRLNRRFSVFNGNSRHGELMSHRTSLTRSIIVSFALLLYLPSST